MKNLKSIIVDDEPKIRKVLEIKLNQYCPDVQILASVENIDAAYLEIINHQPDVVFLDISMPGGNGFELLDKFDRIDFEIVFITGYDEYALDALKVSAVDYLLKPLMTEELVSAVSKVKEKINDKNKAEKYENLKYNISMSANQDSKIALAGTDAYTFVKVNEIVRCEGWQKYTKVYLNKGKCIISSYNIGKFKTMLQNYGFYATHKSHLINTSLIVQYLKEGTVMMSDGSAVPVSRRKKDDFINRILNGFVLK